MKTDTISTPDSLDRRRFVATSCLGMVAGLTATQAGTAPRDPVALAYERYVVATDALHELWELHASEDSDTPEMLRLQAEREDLDTFIATTPPITIEGVCAKLRLVASDVEQGLICGSNGPCLTQAVTFLEKI